MLLECLAPPTPCRLVRRASTDVGSSALYSSFPSVLRPCSPRYAAPPAPKTVWAARRAGAGNGLYAALNFPPRQSTLLISSVLLAELEPTVCLRGTKPRPPRRLGRAQDGPACFCGGCLQHSSRRPHFEPLHVLSYSCNWHTLASCCRRLLGHHVSKERVVAVGVLPWWLTPYSLSVSVLPVRTVTKDHGDLT